MKLKDTIVLGVLFAITILITIYLEPNVLVNPFTPILVLVFYATLIVTHFIVIEKENALKGVK